MSAFCLATDLGARPSALLLLDPKRTCFMQSGNDNTFGEDVSARDRMSMRHERVQDGTSDLSGEHVARPGAREPVITC
jgi:hypothetical protein